MEIESIGCKIELRSMGASDRVAGERNPES